MSVPEGLFAKGCATLGFYYDNPRTTEACKLRSAACVDIDDAFTGDAAAGITVKMISGGPYAVAMHKGPYEKLIESYTWLFDQWLCQNGREPAEEPSYEIYLNNSQTTPPDQLLTEIRLPLKK